MDVEYLAADHIGCHTDNVEYGVAKSKVTSALCFRYEFMHPCQPGIASKIEKDIVNYDNSEYK
jgi:hypothetical protein